MSCADQTREIQVLDAVCGIEYNGEYIVEPHPIMAICFVLPIFMLFILFSPPDKDTVGDYVNLIIYAVADIVAWLSFKSGVEETAANYYCESGTTGWYWLNIFLLLGIIIFSLLVSIGVLKMDFQSDSAGKRVQEGEQVLQQTAHDAGPPDIETNSENHSAIAGYCVRCGTGFRGNNKFCITCGAPIPEKFYLNGKEQNEKRI